MKKKLLILSTFLITFLIGISVFNAKSSNTSPQSYISVTFILSCKTEIRAVPYSLIANDPDYLIYLHEKLEKEICNNSGNHNSGGGLYTTEDETDIGIVTP